MRGDISIYRVSIKWTTEAFDIVKGNPLSNLGNTQQVRISAAEKYVQNDVKLCRSGNCL